MTEAQTLSRLITAAVKLRETGDPTTVAGEIRLAGLNNVIHRSQGCSLGVAIAAEIHHTLRLLAGDTHIEAQLSRLGLLETLYRLSANLAS